MKEGQNRPVNRTYYYIDYRDAVDAIKYRVHRLVLTIAEKSQNDFDTRGFVCPYCQRRYTALQAVSSRSTDGQGFSCVACSTILVPDEESMESKVAQERLQRLQKQTERLVSTLKAIDNNIIPDNDFISASANAIPPSLDMMYTDAYPHGMPSKPTNHNVTQTTTAALGVTVDYGTGQQGSEEEKSRKAAQAQVNQLPDWHLQSTVSGEPIAKTIKDPEIVESQEVKDVQLDAAATDEVAAYYRSLRAQQQEEKDSDDESMEDLSLAASVTGEKPGESAPASTATSKHEEDSDEEFEDV